MTNQNLTYKLRNVVKSVYDGKSKKNILECEFLEIHKGDFVGVSGNSGAGKSTLLNLLGAVDNITHGSIEFKGSDLANMHDKELIRFRREIGFIFQSSHLIEHFSVLENTIIPLKLRSVNRKKLKTQAINALIRVGFLNSHDVQEEKIMQLPKTLSGGEKQRVAIARAIITNPTVILADEPTGSLDKWNEDNIIRLLLEVNQCDRITIVMVSHNQDLIKQCSRLIEVIDGKVFPS